MRTPGTFFYSTWAGGGGGAGKHRVIQMLKNRKLEKSKRQLRSQTKNKWQRPEDSWVKLHPEGKTYNCGGGVPGGEEQPKKKLQKHNQRFKRVSLSYFLCFSIVCINYFWKERMRGGRRSYGAQVLTAQTPSTSPTCRGQPLACAPAWRLWEIRVV